MILLLDSTLAPSKWSRIGGSSASPGLHKQRALRKAWGRGSEECVGEAQQNGMGFENENIPGKTKGRNWCN